MGLACMHTFPITKKVRDMNKNCVLIVRCFEDELGEVLESLGTNMIISSSKRAAEELVKTLHLETP